MLTLLFDESAPPFQYPCVVLLPPPESRTAVFREPLVTAVALSFAKSIFCVEDTNGAGFWEAFFPPPINPVLFGIFDGP